MIEFLTQSDVVLSITEILIASLIPGLGLFFILLLGKGLMKRLNAATQYAVAFSALIALLAITIAVPVFSLIEFDFPDSPVAEVLEEPADPISLEDSGSQPVSIMDFPELGEVPENGFDDQIAFQPKLIEPASSSNIAQPVDKSEISESTNESSVVTLETEEVIPPTLLQQLAQFKLEIPGTWVPFIFGLWVLGVGIFSFRLILSLVYLFRLKRNCCALSGQDERRMNALLDESQVKRRVAFCTSNQLSMPVAVGFFKPMIIIPRTLRDHLSRKELEQVMMHELAHFQRNDDWAKLIQQLVQIPLFFHPALMWLLKALDFTREVACDDWLIARRNVQRESYSESLCKVAEWSLEKRTPLVSLGLAASRSQIERRIKLLLDKQREIFAGIKRGRWLLLTVLIAIAAYVLISNAPNIGFSEISVNAQDEVGVDAGEVMLNHRLYMTANEDFSKYTGLAVPGSSRSWWQNISSIYFPEASSLSMNEFWVTDYQGPIGAENEDFRLPLQFLPLNAGTFEITKLNAIDLDGFIWEVPLGKIQLEVIESDELVDPQVKSSLFCGGLPQTTRRFVDSTEPFAFGYDAHIALENSIYSTNRVEILDVRWGDAFFDDLDVSSFALVQSTSEGPEFDQFGPISLPYELGLGERMFVELSLKDNSEAAIYASDLFVDYRYTTGVDTESVITKAFGCGFEYSSEQKYQRFGSTQIGIAAPPSSEADINELPAVTYKHLAYQALEFDSVASLYINTTSSAYSWWDELTSLVFPEAPEIEIVDFAAFITSPSSQNVSQLRLSVSGSQVGNFEVTKMEGVDTSGGTWEFPLGSITFDVREGFAPETNVLPFRCTRALGQASAIEEGFVGASESYLIRNNFDTTVEITGFHWGEHIFSDFDVASGRLQIRNLSGVGYEPVHSLPVQLEPDNLLLFEWELQADVNAVGATWRFTPFIEYSMGSRSNGSDVIFDALRCGNQWTWFGFGDHLERPETLRLSMPPIAANPEDLDVMYKVLEYTPLSTGYVQGLTFAAPFESRAWWQSIRSVSLPEAPNFQLGELSVASPTLPAAPYGPYYPDQYIGFTLVTPETGLFEITKLQVVDEENVIWEVPIGRIHFDIRDGTGRATAGDMLQTTVGTTAGLLSNNNPDLGTRTVLLLENQGQYPIEVFEVDWDDSLFEDFEIANLIVDPLPITLNRLEKISITAELGGLDDNVQTGWGIFIGYRILEGPFAGQVVFQPRGISSVSSDVFDTFSPVRLGVADANRNIDVSQAAQPPVIYEHLYFQSAHVGKSFQLRLVTPFDAQDFWLDAESIDFKQSDVIEVSGFRFNWEMTAVPPQLMIMLDVMPRNEGQFDIQNLVVTDSSDQTWNVPFGLMQLEIFSALEGVELVQCLRSERASEGSTMTADGIETVNRSQDSAFLLQLSENHEPGSVVDIFDHRWGSDLFVTLSNANSGWRTVSSEDDVTFNIDLPVPLHLMEQIQMDVALEDNPWTQRSIWSTVPAVEISHVNQADRLSNINPIDKYWLALDCGPNYPYYPSTNFNTLAPTLEVEGEPLLEISNPNPQPVIYEHLIYRSGIASPHAGAVFDLQAPPGATSFWENIERISLPELSSINLHLDSFGDDVNFDEQISISLDRRELDVGVYEFSKIHAHDRDGRIWEVPIGTIQLDLRENALFETDEITLGCAAVNNLDAQTMGSFSSFEYLHASVFYSFDGQNDYEFIEHSWGEEILSEHFDVVLFSRESSEDVNPLPVELPFRPQGDEQLLVALYHNAEVSSPSTLTEVSSTIGYKRSSSSLPDTLLHDTGCAGANSAYFTNLGNLNSLIPIEITGDRGGGESGFGALNSELENRDLAINFDGTDFEVLLDDVNGDAAPNYWSPTIANS